MKAIIAIIITLSFSFGSLNAQRPVDIFGQLSVKGNLVVDSKGNAVQLSGMSMFWSQEIGKYYNASCVKWLKDDWKCSIIRAALGVTDDGYLQNPDVEMKKVTNVIDAAISEGIYVIVDFHSHTAEKHLPNALKFFSGISKKYGAQPNIIYELYNEPLNVSWDEVIKPYCEEVIKVIRQNDPDNIIVCGTRNWSQKVAEAANNPIKQDNIAYTLHYYAGTHGKDLLDEAQSVLDKGFCLMVTEYGNTTANGDGPIFEKESRVWYDWMDKNHISHCNWSVADKKEGSAVLVPGANPLGGWPADSITVSGKFVKAELLRKYSEMFGKE